MAACTTSWARPNWPDCTVSGNSASSGGGVYTNTGTTTLFGCSVSGNSADANGGGLFNYFGTTNLTDCVVSGNDAADSGGLGNYHYGTTTLIDSHRQRQLCDRQRRWRGHQL